jgi:hypothetical protein
MAIEYEEDHDRSGDQQNKGEQQKDPEFSLHDVPLQGQFPRKRNPFGRSRNPDTRLPFSTANRRPYPLILELNILSTSGGTKPSMDPPSLNTSRTSLELR